MHAHVLESAAGWIDDRRLDSEMGAMGGEAAEAAVEAVEAHWLLAAESQEPWQAWRCSGEDAGVPAWVVVHMGSVVEVCRRPIVADEAGLGAVLDASIAAARRLWEDECMANGQASASKGARSARGRKNRLAMARSELNAAAERAVLEEDAAALVELLALGVDPNHCFAADGPMLLVAAANGYEEVLRALLGAGADPDKVWPSTSTYGGALAWSVYNKSSECVELLLAASSKPRL